MKCALCQHWSIDGKALKNEVLTFQDRPKGCGFCLLSEYYDSSHVAPHGVYHHASPKHLFRYVDEFTFRLNEGNVENHTIARLNSFVDATVGKRLTYERLIA